MLVPPIRFAPQQNEYFVPQGGLDLVSPPLLLPNGMAFSAENWECDLNGGYSSISGYDKYINGKTASEMDFRVAVVSVTAGFLISGEILRGVDSGATMIFGATFEGTNVIYGGQTNIAIYVADVKGSFQDNEIIEREAGLSPATVYLESKPDYPTEGSAEANELARARAEAATRWLMDKPGSGVYGSAINLGTIDIGVSPIPIDLTVGPALGCFVMADIPYVVRSKNPLQSVGGNTNAVFIRPALQKGSQNRYWEVASDQPLIPTDGAKFEFVLSNFADPSSEPIVFGVSGTSKAFYYTGSTFGFITTGMADDRPSHIAIHQNRIFLSFKGSLQFSSLRDPITTPAFPHLAWTPVVGAGEIATGSHITGLMPITGSQENPALLVSTEDKLFILYGSGPFKLVEFSANTGAMANTLQWIGQPVFQNIFGLTQLSTTAAFGGFVESAISARVKPFLDERVGSATASMICRNKNQYRLFFNDGTALYVTFSQGQIVGIFTQKFKHRVTCAWSCKLGDNSELMLIGTEDGGLYKMDVGTSFAGEAIRHHIRFAFNHLRSPRLNKHFRRTMIEAHSRGYAKANIGYDLDYGGNRRDVSKEVAIQSPDFSSGGFWDADGATWDTGYWDAATATPFQVDSAGTGSNISLRLRGNDTISRPLTVTGVLVDYTVRKAKRGL